MPASQNRWRGQTPCPRPSSCSTWFFTARRAVRCRVCTAFSDYLWTPECNASCPETCPESHRKPVLRGRRSPSALFALWVSVVVEGMVRTMPGVALSEELLGHAGGRPGGTDGFHFILFPFAESAKGKCPRHTRAMGSWATSETHDPSVAVRRRHLPLHPQGEERLRSIVELVLFAPVILLEVAIEGVPGDAIILHRRRGGPAARADQRDSL